MASNLAQLRFLCRRGLKELDMIFSAYLNHHADSAIDEERKLLIHLLKMDDQSLLEFIINTPLEASQQEHKLCEKLKRSIR